MSSIHHRLTIQKEILQIIADIVRNKIREEIGDAKFCILVDEAVDESNREQMDVILRYADRNGFLRERFFEVVNVENTNASTLKKEICNVISKYNLLIENLRGQGYDGASNMRGELKSIREADVIDMIASGKFETGTGANQGCSLQRAGATRWSSHFSSVRRLIDLFGSTCKLLEDLIDKGLNSDIRGEAKGLCLNMKSFEFVFILFFMREVLGVNIDMLCQKLQKDNIDILSAMDLVSTTKLVLQQIRNDRWESFRLTVIEFCEYNDVDVLDLENCYMKGAKRSCQQKNDITVQNHYQFHNFNDVIDFQLMELNDRFSENDGTSYS